VRRFIRDTTIASGHLLHSVDDQWLPDLAGGDDWTPGGFRLGEFGTAKESLALSGLQACRGRKRCRLSATSGAVQGSRAATRATKMELSILVRKSHAVWGGDMNIINQLVDGVPALGIPTTLDTEFSPGGPDRVHIIANTCVDVRSYAREIRASGRHYFVIPFHEDMRGYLPPSIGTMEMCKALIYGGKFLEMDIDVARIERFPELVHYSSEPIPRMAILQAGVLQRARRAFPSSRQEARTIVRDAPQARVRIVPFSTDLKDRFSLRHQFDFADAYGTGRDYILQVGRLEPRKNQLFTALACRDLSQPLVFIATSSSLRYAKYLVDLCNRFRKAPTWIISGEFDDADIGSVHVRRMKDDKKLPWGMLGSAYANAALNVHPAFYELPGLTYIESLSVGTRTVISTKASMAEYIVDPKTASGVYFVDPTNLLDIRRGIMRALEDRRPVNAQVIHQTPAMYCEQIVAAIRESLNPARSA
jgi:glycosyltransferase involved in cell wall biosynthesis